MMKFSVLTFLFLLSLNVFAESPCDVRPGTSVGIKVVEFATGNIIHSKIPLKESTAGALLEEMVSLQDMGVCEEKIYSQKCILKFEKRRNGHYITMFRGMIKWHSWSLKSKDQAQSYVKSLKKAGFCS